MYDIAVILFDMDGVLIDTVSLLKRTYLDVAQFLGVKQPTGQMLTEAIQMAPRKALRSLFEEENETGIAFNRYWRTNIGRVSCFTGIAETLKNLSALEITLGTVTSRNSLDTFSLLDAAGIRKYMGVIVTWGHYRVAKPSPACLVVALSKTGKQPGQVAYIGDQEVDMLAAKNAGILAVGAIWDKNASRENLVKAGAEVIVKEPKEVLELVGGR